MRRSFDALAEHVRTILAHDPMSGHLFVFRNRSAQRVKILWWDTDGYAIYYKRLERGTFQFPASAAAQKTIAIESGELMKLLSGMPVDIAYNTSRHG
jgi:transposase